MCEQACLFEDNAEYNAFVDKFNPKKTTDDCYTPPEVYEVIKDWACNEYGIDENSIVRPFYPGGDYENYDYPGDCVVLDNPPFSILTKICEFYLTRNIPFFLFAPSLTAFSGRNITMKTNHIICDCDIEYENGAIVRTSFITSFGGDIVAQTQPELTKLVNETVAALHARKTKTLPKYKYPHHVVTAALMQKYAKCGVDFKVRRNECVPIAKLDAQAEHKKSIFGCGLLLSDVCAERHADAERAAAERAAAERANVYVWQLSERERRIVAGLK